MKYTNKKFDVALSGDAYRDGWERIFGAKRAADLASDEKLRDLLINKSDEEIVKAMVDAFANADAVVICMTCGGELPGDRWCHICGAYK